VQTTLITLMIIIGMIYLYGGNGCGIGSCTDRSIVLSQLWAYNISLNQWCWISGSALPSATDPPKYPTYPGARSYYKMVTQHATQHLHTHPDSISCRAKCYGNSVIGN
jgi:hypothetical protein